LSLVGELAWIESFPQAVAAVVSEIEEWLKNNPSRDYRPQPAMTPPKISYSDPDAPLPRWDSRNK
jgi:hypothetical protein